MKRKKSYDKNVYRSLTFITQFGINLLVPMALMSWLGIWLDEKCGTSYWMVILFFVGAIAGGQNCYRMAKTVFGSRQKDPLREAYDQAEKQKADIRNGAPATAENGQTLQEAQEYGENEDD